MYRIILSSILVSVSLIAAPAASADEIYDTIIERLERDLSLDGELALRIIAQGIENAQYHNQSTRAANLVADDIICIFAKPTGQHFTNVMCRQYRYHSDNALVGSTQDRGASGGLTTGNTLLQYRMRERQAEIAVEQLPGLPSMNDRLVAEGLAGLPLPQGLPNRAELDQFVHAYRQVNQLSRQYDPLLATSSGENLNALRREADDAMVSAIQEAGLNWERYNDIAEHVGTHPELFEYVRSNYNSRG